MRLIAQFAFALVVARLAVTWALERYKSEKLWDRQLSAYTDLVFAVDEMRRVNRQWFEDMATDRERSEAFDSAQRARYEGARRQLEEAAASGQLLLPLSTLTLLAALEASLDRRTVFEHWSDALDDHWLALQEAHKALIREGRNVLGRVGQAQP